LDCPLIFHRTRARVAEFRKTRYDITSDRDIREAIVKTGSYLKAQPSTRTVGSLRRTS